MAPKRAPRLLIVDDDRAFINDLCLCLESLFHLETAHSIEEAEHTLGRVQPDVALLDIDLGNGDDGFTILERMQRDPLSPPAIMLTGDASVDSVVRACKLGAFHYLPKPPDTGDLVNLINQALVQDAQRRELSVLREERAAQCGVFRAVDPLSRRMMAEIEEVASTEATVRIQGATGVGKEMVARRIHELSEHRRGPFVAVNCAAIPGELIESELFGHVKGSFTGATDNRKGKIAKAQGGTLFLDEIGEAPAPVQAKLLRVLENRVFSPVGSDRELETDARVVTATSRDLESEVTAGRFRQDLFFRLDVYTIFVPPLAQRPGDILPLARDFLLRAARDCRKVITNLSPEAEVMLLDQPWEGNVRELRNTVERAVIRCRGNRLTPGDLLASSRSWCAPGRTYEEAKQQVLLDFKRRYLATRLTEAGGNVAAAARAADIPAPSLHRHLREAGLDPDEYRPEASR